MKKIIVLLSLVASGCVTAPKMQIDFNDNSRIYLLCEKYDKPADDRVKYRCNGKRLLEFQLKF